MDEWAWEQLQPWLAVRLELPVGPLFCVVNGPTRGRHWSSAAAGAALRAGPPRTPACDGALPRTGLRHLHAVEMAHEGIPLIVIQRQLGHNNLGISSIYLQGIDSAENHRHPPRPPRADGPRQHVPTAGNQLENGAPAAPLIAAKEQRSSTRRAQRLLCMRS